MDSVSLLRDSVAESAHVLRENMNLTKAGIQGASGASSFLAGELSNSRQDHVLGAVQRIGVTLANMMEEVGNAENAIVILEQYAESL